MTLHDYAKTSFAGIRSNKSRSALTILGIVIGIAAIILIMSVGKGAENLILEEVRGLGSRTIIVEPGREPRGPSDFGEIFTNSLRSRAVEALRNPSYVQGLKELTPAVAGAVTVSYGSETKRTNFRGSTELIAKILELYPSEGSFFEEEDVKSLAPVAVIGADVKKELFGSSDAAGQKIKIEGRLFRVVGVLPSKGKASFIDIDDMVFIPYTTAQKYLLGINYFHAIIVQTETQKIKRPEKRRFPRHAAGGYGKTHRHYFQNSLGSSHFHRRHISRRGRNRDYEHNACCGYGTNAGNRTKKSSGGNRQKYPYPISS